MSSNTLRQQELHEKIAELELSLSELKQQLKQLEVDEQHRAIDHLEIYLEQVDHKYENLRNFWPILLEEFRNLFGSSAEEKK